jgi:hypothetical protein
MKKRGQYAIESMVVMAFGFILLAVLSFVVYNEFGNQLAGVNIAQLQKFGSSVITSASKLSYFGETSVITIDPMLPPGVSRIYVENNKTLVIAYDKNGRQEEMVFISPVNLAVDFNEFNKGTKNIVIKFKENYVSVCERNQLRCNNFCDHTVGYEGMLENATNAPSDCCTAECNGCAVDASPSVCGSYPAGHNSLCYPSCYGHNGCNKIC